MLWLGLAGLTLTCARPGAMTEARAEPPRAQPRARSAPAAVAAPSAVAPAPAPAARGPLSTFFDALSELHEGKRQSHLHIVWFGDSHTNADFLSGTVRSIFDASFGGGGPGFVRIGMRPYRHDGVKLGRVGRWNVDPDPPARRTPQDDGVFGLGGTRAEPSSDASFSLQLTASQAAPGELGRFELSYSLPPGASFKLELGDKKQLVDARTSTDVAASGIAHLTLTAPLTQKLLLTPASGAPRFFGVIVERSAPPGIVLDTLGIDGARLETPLAWDEAAFVEEVARRAPDLFVVSYGTNEAFDGLKVEKYAEHLAALVGRLRRAGPRASCLVLGPTDAPLGDGSVPRVAEVAAVLQKAAASLDCSFASLQRLMGGEGSFARGLKAKERLAQRDKLHLTPKGYDELGHALAQQLLDAHSAGRADLP